MSFLTTFTRAAACAALGCVLCTAVEAQYFQHHYGNALDNAFTKVIPHGPNYYVIGRDQPTAGALARATVARINGSGQLQWVLRLDLASQWNDAVLTPTGNLIMVGNTLPFDASSQSLLGIVTPAGVLSSAQTLNVPGRDWFNRIVRNPTPENANFPYYILGGQWEGGTTSATWDDIVLLTINAAGAIGWKKVYKGPFGSTDDEFARDLKVLPNGDLLLAGNVGSGGVLFRGRNTGDIENAVGPDGVSSSFTFADVAPVNNGFLALGNTFPTFQAYLMKFDTDLLPVWQVRLPQLTAVRNVWQADSSIYVSGSAPVGGLTRGVVLRFLDAPGGPVLRWMKYLHQNETAYAGGAAWPVSSVQVAYADGRIKPNGFGGECAFLSVSDPELNSCMTLTAPATVAISNFSFNSPVALNPQPAPTPTITDITSRHSLIAWQEAEACAKICRCPSDAFKNMSYRPISGPNVPIDCGEVAIWECRFPAFNLGGEFMCEGSPCPPTPSMSWVLNHPTLGQVDNGATNGPGFQISIPNSSFPLPGLYTLTIAGICGEDTCYCEILIETPGCGGGCTADFSAAKLNCDTYQFFAIANGTAPFTYCWDFDGNPATCESTVPNPTWQFPACNTYTVCLTVTDALNCSATVCQAVNVIDIVPPVAVCNPGVGVDLDPITCVYNVTPAFVDGGSFDNCQIQSMTVSPSVLTGCGDHAVTLTVTDWCGNTSTCTMGVQTLEVVPPDIKCPNDLTVQAILSPTGVCSSVVNGIAPQASDNCNLLGVAYSINMGSLIFAPDASGSSFNPGTTIITYFAADDCLNTASCSFTVTVLCPECECLTPSGAGDELVMNGDFDGSGGFTSDYTNNCTSQGEGQYCITLDASSINPGFSPCKDKDNPSASKIFVANGSLNANANVLCYSFNVASGRDYIFTFYHASVSGANPAQFGVYVDGMPIGIVAQASPVPCEWRRHCVRLNSGNKTTINVCIRNQNTQAQGNDFAIDKVSFRECKKCAPLPNNAVLWMPMDEDFGDNTINSTINGFVAIPNGTIGSGGPNPVPGKIDASNSGNGALSFVGPPASPVSVSNDPKLNFGSGSFTIDAWVKTNLTTQSAPVVVKQNNQGGYAFGIAGTPVTGFPFLSLGTPNGPPLYFQGIHPVALGQWNFVAVTVQPPVGANPGTVIFYTGGDPGGSSAYNTSMHTFLGATNASTNGPLYIGYNPQNPHIDIAIDELEMFDTALAPSELKRIWEADSEGKCRSSCTCGGFSKMAVRNKTGNLNLPVACGGGPVALPCYTGQSYHLVGVFQCDGTGCPDEHQINWMLNGPSGSHSGSFTDNDPFFGINLLPTYFNQPGIYTLTMSGDCGTQACSCVVQFVVDCPPLCPCNQQEIAALQANVNKGFAVAVSKASCKACFSPLALSDCETVQWYINSTAGAPIGSTVGKQTFCHTFSASGTYTIIMVVTRLRPDGSLCEVFTKSQIITITCGFIVDCTDSVLPNPRFNDNPVPGDLGSGGEAPGWAKIEHSGDPHELFLLEYGNSQDGWVMGLTGSYAGAGILGTEAPLCVSKTDSGTLTMTLRTPGDPIPGVEVKIGRKPPGGANIVQLYTGNTLSWPNCQDASCYRLAVLEDLLPFDDDDWYELRIPYNLSDWAALDSCGDQAGGIPARMAIYVSNLLSEEQRAAGPVRDGILIDHICFRGTTVSTHDVAQPQRLRLYPNPTPGHFTLELPAPAPTGMTLRITDPTGRLLLEIDALAGNERQQVQAHGLPAGFYVVQAVHEGRVVGASRFVKQ